MTSWAEQAHHRARRIRQAEQIQPGGLTVQRWRCRNLDSGGTIECSTREQAQRFVDMTNTARVLETATRTTWPDGSQYTTGWTEVAADG